MFFLPFSLSIYFVSPNSYEREWLMDLFILKKEDYFYELAWKNSPCSTICGNTMNLSSYTTVTQCAYTLRKHIALNHAYLMDVYTGLGPDPGPVMLASLSVLLMTSVQLVWVSLAHCVCVCVCDI